MREKSAKDLEKKQKRLKDNIDRQIMQLKADQDDIHEREKASLK